MIQSYLTFATVENQKSPSTNALEFSLLNHGILVYKI